MKLFQRIRDAKEDILETESGDYSKKVLKTLFRDYRIFTLLVLFVFYKTGSEPIVLVGAVTTFLSIEVMQLARIRINKGKRKRLIIKKEGIDDEDKLDAETFK